MYIIHNTKADNWIKDYNRRIILKEGNNNFPAFMRRIITALILNQNDEAYKGIKRIAAYIEENLYLERYEKWLTKYQLNTVSFDKITAVLISSEIKTSAGDDLTGYAVQYGNGYYVLVNDTEELEVTISILTHEIMHVELEPLLRKVEQQKGMEIPETAKEELVVLLEHTFLMDELQIKAWDIQIEKVRSFQELLQLGIEKAIAHWAAEHYNVKL